MAVTSDSMPFSDDELKLVEMYAKNPNVTQIATELGVNRSTIYRRLEDPRIRQAIIDLRVKRDQDRNYEIQDAQDTALDLIRKQLKHHLTQCPTLSTITDTQKLMQIAEKLAAMKSTVKRIPGRGGEEDFENDAEPWDWEAPPAGTDA